MTLKIILGEFHDVASYKYMKKITKFLSKHNMLDVMLQENAFNYELLKRKDIEGRLESEDYMISYLHYEIALENNLPVIGIDIDPNDPVHSVGLVKSFKKREDRMLKVLKDQSKKYNVILTVGDTHLRSYVTQALGRSSPLYKAFKNDVDAYIIRSDRREIDFDLPKNTYTYKDFYELIKTEEFINKYSREERKILLK